MPELAKPGDDERAGDRTGAGERHQMRVLRHAAAEDVLREERQEREQRSAEERRRETEHRKTEQRRMCECVLEAALQLVMHARLSGRRRVPDVQQENRGNHREERQAVETEARHHAEGGKRRAGEQRTDHARQVELNRVERDRIGHVVLGDERRQQ